MSRVLVHRNLAALICTVGDMSLTGNLLVFAGRVEFRSGYLALEDRLCRHSRTLSEGNRARRDIIPRGNACLLANGETYHPLILIGSPTITKPELGHFT